MKLDNKIYDLLNKLQRWLPAIGVLYLALANIWNLPYGDEVNATVLALATFLASILEIANVSYLKDKNNEAPQTTFNEDASVAENAEEAKG